MEDGIPRHLSVFAIRAIDTLAAGDALHGGFALALAEGMRQVDSLRFGAAVAGLKCARLGGSSGMPTRAEVEALLAEQTPPAWARPNAAGNSAALSDGLKDNGWGLI